MKNRKIKIIRSITVAIALFVCMIGAEAQENLKEFEVGFRFMPTFSSFDLKNSAGETVKGEGVIGFGFDGFFGYNFSEHFGVQIELIYSSLGQKYVEEDVERQVNLAYFNIPILFSYNTGKTESINFNAVLGPQIGISIGTNLKVNNTGPSAKEAKLSVKAGDIGFAYGAGVDIGLNQENTIRLGVGFRGVYGLVDISDNSETLVTDTYFVLDKTKLITYSGYIGVSWLF